MNLLAKRSTQIAQLFIKYGKADLLPKLGLKVDIRKIEIQNECEELNVIHDLQALSPVFVRLAQQLNNEKKIPSPYQEQIASWQIKQDAFSFEEVDEVFYTEFGLNIETAFKKFESAPTKTCLFYQSHRATLLNDQEVNVCIQRPNILPQIFEDLEILKHFSIHLDKENENNHFYKKFECFKENLFNELDFKKHAQENISEIIEDYSGKRVLTTKFLSDDSISLTPIPNEIPSPFISTIKDIVNSTTVTVNSKPILQEKNKTLWLVLLIGLLISFGAYLIQFETAFKIFSYPGFSMILFLLAFVIASQLLLQRCFKNSL